MGHRDARFEQLDRDGYIVLPALIDVPTIARQCLAFDAAPPQRDGTQHVRLDDATPQREAWSELTKHPIVRPAAAHVLGSSLHVRDVHGRNPLPGYGQQGLHADSPNRAPGAPYEVVTALFMPRRWGGYRCWAELLARTFAIDVLCCPTCGGGMKLLAMVTDR